MLALLALARLRTEDGMQHPKDDERRNNDQHPTANAEQGEGETVARVGLGGVVCHCIFFEKGEGDLGNNTRGDLL